MADKKEEEKMKKKSKKGKEKKKRGNGKRKKKRGKGKRKKEEINSDHSCLVQTLLESREHLFKIQNIR